MTETKRMQTNCTIRISLPVIEQKDLNNTLCVSLNSVNGYVFGNRYRYRQLSKSTFFQAVKLLQIASFWSLNLLRFSNPIAIRSQRRNWSCIDFVLCYFSRFKLIYLLSDKRMKIWWRQTLIRLPWYFSRFKLVNLFPKFYWNSGWKNCDTKH
jgi:hypothetical protein